MKCPICGNELEEKAIYCPCCGQAISQPDASSTSLNSYWDENNVASQKYIAKQKVKAAKVQSEIQKNGLRHFSALLYYVSLFV